MSTGEEDRIARSVALEKTYVHDVYDHMSALQYPEHRNTTPWPKVKKFLNELEPGSIVCDVGCGNGKYLKVNPSIFKIGSDRCHKLTQIAKDDDNEVLLCDNLTLPFRDETFDAVLSIAVIHHFATKERRVGALRELARVLRIGGRLMITVWAMEQKDRKFETQDVLVQWHHPQFYRSPSLEFSTTATATSEEDFSVPYRMSQSHVSDDADSVFSRSSSLQQDSRTGRSRLRLFQSLRSIKTSPSSSSLSSPNETCYSFVRKALQKLSRSSKKDKHRSRAWFLESWASFGKDDHLPATRYDPEGCEESADIQDLPIELRRMDKEEEPKREKSSAMKSQEGGLTKKSKSLNDILSQATLAPSPITRSHSGIVALDGYKIKIKTSAPKVEMDSLKPKLVKQKKSICEEDFEYDEARDKATDMKRLVKELPIFKVSMEKPEKFNVLKQKSLTEDIMSADRLREKEKVRQNIQKQASLNEDLIYRRQRTIDSFKDNFLTNSSKKFQMLRSGLTSKLKNSTTNIEKVTGVSIKSGFAKIFHGLTGGELVTIGEPVQPQSTPVIPSVRKSSSEDRGDEFPIERRCSHEENSDSSKDNSLQSDTSVDSEDSIISVIERIIPKPEQATSPTKLTSPGPHSPKLVLGGVLSHPSSPKISQVMQYPASKTKAFSLPASPRTIVFSPSIKQTFKIPAVAHIPPSNGNGAILTPNGKILTPNGSLLVRENSANGSSSSPSFKPPTEGEPVLKLSPMKQVTAARMKSFGDKEMLLLSEKLSVLSAKETEPRGDVCEGDENQKPDTEQPMTPKEQVKKEETPARVKSGVLKPPYSLSKKPPISPYATYLAHQTRLQSYELFNPETEDIDTDSSGVSTPDSVGSVISVKLDSSNGTPNNEPSQLDLDDVRPDESKECSISSLPSLPKPTTSTDGKTPSQDKDIHPSDLAGDIEPQIATVFETVASVATSLESTVQVVLQADPDATPIEHLRPKREDSKEKLIKYPSFSKSPEDETWDRECRQYIVDLAENLSERLLAEIDRYKEQNINIEKEFLSFSAMDVEDPYLTKLSEDLSHVSKLTKELSEDLESKPEPDTEAETEQAESSDQVTEIKKMDSIEEISDVILDSKPDESDSSPKEDKQKTPLLSDLSTDAESPGSITGWLDSRRNTIESGFWKDHEPVVVAPKEEEESKPVVVVKSDEQKVEIIETEETHRLSITIQTEKVRKLSKSEITSHTRLSIESTDTVDVSERTVSSSEDSTSKRDTTQTETSSGLSIESDLCELDKSADTSKSTDMKYSGSQVSLLRPGESIESSDAGDISDRTGSVSDFSRQNTESRSVITQSSASLASWSDCSKDIRFADRRTARCDGRSSSEETNPRAMLTRQQAATQEPSEVKLESTDASLSGSTSQDSLTSESGGGSIMFHRYYHVFREGELDALIEEFVENLHIISSYYDHTNWCIIAEKVRVWTI